MRVEIFDAIIMSKLTNQTETKLIVKIFSTLLSYTPSVPKQKSFSLPEKSNFFNLD